MRILICETDPGMREIMKTVLETRGFSVSTIADFDVVLTNCRDVCGTPDIQKVYMSASQPFVDQVRHSGVPAWFKTDDLDKLIELLKATAR